jgi:hypothetical protein
VFTVYVNGAALQEAGSERVSPDDVNALKDRIQVCVVAARASYSRADVGVA